MVSIYPFVEHSGESSTRHLTVTKPGPSRRLESRLAEGNIGAGNAPWNQGAEWRALKAGESRLRRRRVSGYGEGCLPQLTRRSTERLSSPAGSGATPGFTSRENVVPIDKSAIEMVHFSAKNALDCRILHYENSKFYRGISPDPWSGKGRPIPHPPQHANTNFPLAHQRPSHCCCFTKRPLGEAPARNAFWRILK